MTVARHVTDTERRARLAVRHALAPSARVATPEAVTRAMTVLHATEPATVYLSCQARSASLTAADVTRALAADRTLVKQLAMRRTLFVFPRDLLPAAWAAPSARVAATERARMVTDVVRAGLTTDGEDWIDRACAEILATLTGEGLTTREIRALVSCGDVRLWPMFRPLSLLDANADIVRGVNTGGWHTSRPRWSLMGSWLGTLPAPLDAATGYRELIRRWLHTFGPGTEDDIVWWLGATKTAVRAALASLGAVPVSLDGGASGYLLPDDLDEVPSPPSWAALLPVLDPTTMGWKHRDFYLAPHRAQIFDTRGNAGTTAWLDGRIVGCWTQDPDGAVRVHPLEPVTPSQQRLLTEEADRLSAWLAGFRVSSVYRSPAMTLSGTATRTS
ncbi:winged helix DNA-binding domain-containing protein [Actinoplanes sp. NPDC051851]|uniref:winged helix DNA-binding domain-containing protein n=1 Tax=Actinoplanes sp. NPDC051851 TaxID=3154753 RepID=UPI00343BF903